jgi:uncharacterized iron-regulated protein
VNIRQTFLFALSLASLSSAQAQPEIMNLPVGDPERKDQQVSVQVDVVVDTLSGNTLSPQALAEHLADDRLILIAEEHNDLEYHRVQLRVLELLQETGQPLVIGLEMFPVDDQPLLNAWIGGMLREAEFIERSDWYGNWGYHWGYYQEIFQFARIHGIPMVALRASRESAADVRANGVADAREENGTALLPQADVSSQDHRTLFSAFFEPDDPVHGELPEGQWETLFAAQCTWDAVMAYNAAKALEAHPESTLVVLAGNGHVVYELGIARQIKGWYEGPVTTIVPVPAEAGGARVQASIGDFLWGVPATTHPTFPELGIFTMGTEGGRRVIHVEPNSPAHHGELETGDILIRFKDVAMTSRSALNRTLATVEWGDEAALSIQRNGREHEFTITFRR